jgi:hypothetical protein
VWVGLARWVVWLVGWLDLSVLIMNSIYIYIVPEVTTEMNVFYPSMHSPFSSNSGGSSWQPRVILFYPSMHALFSSNCGDSAILVALVRFSLHYCSNSCGSLLVHAHRWFSMLFPPSDGLDYDARAQCALSCVRGSTRARVGLPGGCGLVWSRWLR